MNGPAYYAKGGNDDNHLPQDAPEVWQASAGESSVELAGEDSHLIIVVLLCGRKEREREREREKGRRRREGERMMPRLTQLALARFPPNLLLLPGPRG